MAGNSLEELWRDPRVRNAFEALTSGLQGASNGVASTVSAPVDGIAWLLGKAGVDVGATPFGGSAWMERMGMTRQPQNALAGAVGEGLGSVLPVAAPAKAQQIAAGLLRMGENAAARGVNAGMSGGQRGVILYHGTNQQTPLKEIQPGGGTFGGLFASQGKGAAASHGDALYRMTVPDDRVLTQGALNGDLYGQAVDAARGMVRGPHADEIANMVVSGRGAFESSIPEKDLLRVLGADDLGAADWQLQRLRGEVSKRLGFNAVEMPDEHGLSYLVTGGAKPRPANTAARELARPAAPASATAAEAAAAREYVDLPERFKPGRRLRASSPADAKLLREKDQFIKESGLTYDPVAMRYYVDS